MKFDNEKKVCLSKLENSDKSKKGSVDEEIRDLIKLINQHPDYYTTSSCAGRIMILSPSASGKKYETTWHYQSHKAVSYKDLSQVLDKLPKEDLWFRMESPILHLAARDLDSADLLLKLANNSGFRRSAILSFKNRIIIEIFMPDRIDAPIAYNGKLIVGPVNLKVLVNSANSKLSLARKKLKKFEKIIKNLLLK